MAMTDEEERAYKHAYYLAHREEILAAKREYYKNNQRECSLRSSAYYLKHREKILAEQRARYRKKKHSEK